jgi:RimJ/RimL family protein N-acetyltransferase
MRHAPETIDTPRLVLRRPAHHDAGAIFDSYAADPEVTRWLGWRTHRTIADTRAFVAASDAEWLRWPAGPYLVTGRTDGSVLGGTGLAFESSRRASTGYVLARDVWGQGFATEALLAMVTVAEAVGLTRLYAICHADHHASAHVLEKAGFSREGLLRRHTEFPNVQPGVLLDVLCYARVFEP